MARYALVTGTDATRDVSRGQPGPARRGILAAGVMPGTLASPGMMTRGCAVAPRGSVAAGVLAAGGASDELKAQPHGADLGCSWVVDGGCFRWRVT